MPRIKINTQNDTKTRRTPHDTTDIKKTIFGVVFFIFLFYFIYIHNFLNEFFKKCWITALVRSMTFIGS